MRVLSYNIQEGGSGRLRRIANVIRRQHPDAVALQEVTSQDHAVILARELDMDLVVGETNIPYHIAWLSRLPIQRSENYPLPTLSKGLLEIEVEWMGRPLRLFTSHLASRHDPHLPEHEIVVILDILRPAPDTPHLLAGDFNSLRPGDAVGHFPSGETKRGDAAPGATRRTIQLALDAGYTDCYRAVHADAGGYTYPSKAPWLRLDYIFASPGMASRLRKCNVVHEQETEQASDHLPILAEFS